MPPPEPGEAHHAEAMTGLLVSVRSPQEAEAALAGGAGVIDVKEPSRGPLGRADRAVVAEVVRAVADRAVVTAAAGELVDLDPPMLTAWLDRGVQLVKAGPARLTRDAAARRLAQLATIAGQPRRCVAVAYADWRKADAPRPEEIVAIAADQGFGWLLVDTFSKTGAGLLGVLSSPQITGLVQTARGAGLRVALAGRIGPHDLAPLLAARPELIGLRGAACFGGRRGEVSKALVHRLASQIAAVEGPPSRQPSTARPQKNLTPHGESAYSP